MLEWIKKLFQGSAKPIESNKVYLDLDRYFLTEYSTIGHLTIPGEQWLILEDPIRDKKIPGDTAIPEGEYRIVPAWSQKKKAIVPFLLDVPNYTAVEIHIGNSPKDTQGCLLPGKSHGTDVVYNSTLATKEVYTRLCKEWNKGHETWIRIKNPK